MWAKDVLRDANDAGVARPTLYTAKAKLRVSSDKIGTQGWQWSLPEGDDPDPHHNVHNLHNLQSKRTPDPALIKEDIEGIKDTEVTQGAVRHVPEHNLPRHLSADEANERVQRLIDEGMSENDAIAEVLGEEL